MTPTTLSRFVPTPGGQGREQDSKLHKEVSRLKSVEQQAVLTPHYNRRQKEPLLFSNIAPSLAQKRDPHCEAHYAARRDTVRPKRQIWASA